MRIIKGFILLLGFVMLVGCSFFNSSSTTEYNSETTTEAPDPIEELSFETSVKKSGITFTFINVDENYVKSIKVINKTSLQEFTVENNTITIPGDYNVQYAFEIVIIDNNNIERIIGSPFIKPGSSTNPYEIDNFQELNDVRNNLGASYKLTNDIDLVDEEFVQIGEDVETAFTGVFNGNGHVIKNLSAYGEKDYYALFFLNEGLIKNIGLEDVNINILGYASGIATINYHGKIENSYVTGTIKGQIVGGLVAGNFPDDELGTPAYINNCYTDVIVEGSTVGGLVGENLSNISNSFALGDVSVGKDAGGLVGANLGVIDNSYAVGNITTTKDAARLGGLVGANGGEINNSFASGDVTSTGYAGGLVGINSYDQSDGDISNSYRFMGQLVTAEYTKNYFGKDISIDDLKIDAFYNNSLLWNENIWDLSKATEGYYPVHHNSDAFDTIPTEYREGSLGNPIKISTKAELINIGSNAGYAYTLVDDIDLAGEEWTPLEGFMGEFSGNGYIISNLIITTVSDDWNIMLGLFAENYGILRNFHLENISINVSSSNNLYVGGLAGVNHQVIKDSNVTGSIEVNGFSEIGGLVGQNNGFISNTHADVDITASHYSHLKLGGLVGNHVSGEINKSYAMGELSGIVDSPASDASFVAGLVGKLGEGTINDSLAISNVVSNGNAGYLVGDGIDGQINNSYHFENQVLKDEADNDVTAVDQAYTNISSVTLANLIDAAWYQDNLGFDDEIWYLENISEGCYPVLMKRTYVYED